ncbi:MAG: hypothetical protein EB084_07795 [Proteobacteria bacterium]|nr:hypothetical protein [Pseudomonadota bacterium]
MAAGWSRNVIVCVALLALMSPAQAQYGKPRAPKRQQTAPTSAPQFQKTGISVNRANIQPGQDLETLFGVVGPPDHVDPVRGKEPANDYVRFTYTSLGFVAHVKTVKNRDNVVESLVVMQSNVKLVGIPFNVGDSYKLALQEWGQPDQQEVGFMAYWKRGVYVAVNDSGIITGITLAEPGKVDETERSGQGVLLRPVSAR